jgi:hypothetical protein
MPTLGKTIDVSQVKPRGRAPGPVSPRDVMAGVTAMAEFGRALDVFRQWAAQWVATREPEHERMGRVCCEIARERWHIARHALERDVHLIAADGIETDPAELAPW